MLFTLFKIDFMGMQKLDVNAGLFCLFFFKTICRTFIQSRTIIILSAMILFANLKTACEFLYSFKSATG